MLAQDQSVAAIDIIAIVVSLVSLIITVVGFFASLKFYRDGVSLQGKANDALTKLEEKTQFIQSQVGGMFDKTLEAAIGKREALSESFEELSDQLERTKAKLIEESIKQIGVAGEQEQSRLTHLVDNQIDLIRQKVAATRESAEEVAQGGGKPEFAPSIKAILNLLAEEKAGLAREEIHSRLNIAKSLLSVRLHQLIDTGYIERRDDKYYNVSGLKYDEDQ